MKKLIGALFVMLIVLSGCSNSNKWIGIWKNESCMEAVIEGPDNWEHTNGKCILTINEDGTGTLSIQNTTLTSFIGTYPIQWTKSDGDSIKIICGDFSGVYQMTYTDKDSFTLLVDRNMSEYNSPGHLQFMNMERQ